MKWSCNNYISGLFKTTDSQWPILFLCFITCPPEISITYFSQLSSRLVFTNPHLSYYVCHFPSLCLFYVDSTLNIHALSTSSTFGLGLESCKNMNNNRISFSHPSKSFQALQCTDIHQPQKTSFAYFLISNLISLIADFPGRSYRFLVILSWASVVQCMLGMVDPFSGALLCSELP